MVRKDTLDLWGVFLLAALATAVVGLFPEHSSPLRVTLGLLLILLLPGYSLAALLFPRREDLSSVERWVVSAGLSVAAVTVVGLAFNYSPWGVRTFPVCAGLCGFILTCNFFTRRRRRNLAPENRFRPFSRNSGGVAGAVLSVGVTALIGGIISVTLALRPPAQSTAFYILGEGGVLEGYPRNVVAGEPFGLTFGITNYEPEPESFIIKTRIDNSEQQFETPLLDYGESWQDELSLSVPLGFGETTAEFGLYRGNALEPYRNLRLDLEFSPGTGPPDLSDGEP